MKTNQRNAPQKRNGLFAQTALVLAAALLLSHCTPDPEKAAPVPTAGTEQTTPQPGAVPSPLSREVAEDLTKMPFPQGSSANGRTAYEESGVVHFNDPLSLSMLPQQAASLTYAFWPFYIQKVGNAWVHVKENNGAGYHEAFRSDYGHYLLLFQNFKPCPIINDGIYNYGKPDGTSCLPLIPAREPRKLATSLGDQWIKIYAYDENNPKRVFDLEGVTIMRGPIQLWFREKNGAWKAWKNLPEGPWTTTQANGITEVLIGSAIGNTFAIDDIRLRVPAY